MFCPKSKLIRVSLRAASTSHIVTLHTKWITSSIKTHTSHVWLYCVSMWASVYVEMKDNTIWCIQGYLEKKSIACSPLLSLLTWENKSSSVSTRTKQHPHGRSCWDVFAYFCMCVCVTETWVEKPCYGKPLEEHLALSGRDIAFPIEACVTMLLECGMQEEVRQGWRHPHKGAVHPSNTHLAAYLHKPHKQNMGNLKNWEFLFPV